MHRPIRTPWPAQVIWLAQLGLHTILSFWAGNPSRMALRVLTWAWLSVFVSVESTLGEYTFPAQV